jgi:hypothetical protein
MPSISTVKSTLGQNPPNLTNNLWLFSQCRFMQLISLAQPLYAGRREAELNENRSINPYPKPADIRSHMAGGVGRVLNKIDRFVSDDSINPPLQFSIISTESNK